ncbi:hypothetical protein FEM48_Zijuj02G0037200 [Ziziphus jujuba var. spinosa]|uniref:Uncharacterized protein n=1 Tax=Ziziphus jujuba var. spinosa TaxID=714518 RepID=A0A978VTF3_ZIZJJ|nr:hypothetical protein FEM48_Zijuj02G0037200 [Ziziphus jujuba var. spinosa]
MASSSNTSKSYDQQQHYADKEAAQNKQNGKASSTWSSSKQMKYIAFVVLVIIVAVPNPELTSFAGNFSFVMRAYNPNKLVEDFFQRPFNVTRIHFLVLATFSFDNGADIINEYLLHGRITTNISVKVVLKFRYGSWISMPCAIGIYCQPAAILLRRNFQTTGCYVDL